MLFGEGRSDLCRRTGEPLCGTGSKIKVELTESFHVFRRLTGVYSKYSVL